MEIKDNQYDQLLAFIETGVKNKMPEELLEYVKLLDVIHGWHLNFRHKSTIINLLQKEPYNLSRYLAVQYYSDAINYFHLDAPIKKQAFRNMYADWLDKAALLVFNTSTCSKDIDIFKNTIYAAREMRQLNVPEVADIPKDFFKKPYKIYVLDPKVVGRKRKNRNLLAKHIDSLDIPEAYKEKAKSDAGISDITFLEEDEDENQEEI